MTGTGATTVTGTYPSFTIDSTNTTYTVGDGGLTTNDFTDADHTKLNGIEANATADQTGAEIKTAYEAEADTNAFTDAEKTKLSGIEASADVTDTANVTSAGALMDSEVTNLAQVKAFDSSDYATAAQGSTADSALQNVVEDTTPQLGGNLDANNKEIQNVNDLGIGFSGNVNYSLEIHESRSNSSFEMVRMKSTGSAYGRIISFLRSTNPHGYIGLSTVNMGQGVYMSSQQGGLKFQNQFSTVVVEPCNSLGSDKDNSVDLGRSNNRFDDVYATNGTIQTSDRNEKQNIEQLSDAERRVAVAAKGLLRKFKWIGAVEEKGDDARIHFGIIAQDLQRCLYC